MVIDEELNQAQVGDPTTLVHSHLGPLYTTVEKCTGRSRVLAQDMVFLGEGWYAGEDEKIIK